LLACSNSNDPSRFISVSSRGHARGSVRIGDYNFEDKTGLGGYDEWKAYGQSKTANIWMANSIHRHYSHNILSVSLHPGAIITPLSGHFSPEVMKAFDTPINRVYLKSPAQGAATQVFCAVSEEARSWGGRWISDCAVQPKEGGREREGIVVGNDDGFAEWAFDEEGEETLWKESFQMVGLPVAAE
jgi:NAD(P)-dependent dehydrogenase (short-subunit alcohol dehydrogenase family)